MSYSRVIHLDECISSLCGRWGEDLSVLVVAVLLSESTSALALALSFAHDNFSIVFKL